MNGSKNDAGSRKGLYTRTESEKEIEKYMEKLTNEEIMRVFALYGSADVMTYVPGMDPVCGKIVGIHYTQEDVIVLDQDGSWRYWPTEVKLILYHKPEPNKVDHSLPYIEEAMHIFDRYGNVPIGHAYKLQHLLKSQVAQPLWFGIDHWANGKTAIELGIAVEKSNL